MFKWRDNSRFISAHDEKPSSGNQTPMLRRRDIRSPSVPLHTHQVTVYYTELLNITFQQYRNQCSKNIS